jgi:hypothetical protein
VKQTNAALVKKRTLGVEEQDESFMRWPRHSVSCTSVKRRRACLHIPGVDTTLIAAALCSMDVIAGVGKERVSGGVFSIRAGKHK